MLTYGYAIIVLLLVLIFNVIGISDGLYVTIGYYDIFMHILGGLGIGLFAAALHELHAPRRFRTKKAIVVWVLLAGLAWELFEAYYNIAGAPLGTKAYWIDTVKDLFDDCLGGFFIAWVRSRYWASLPEPAR